jgi:hypothetical protein
MTSKTEKPYLRRALFTLLLMGIAAPWVVGGSLASMGTIFNAPIEWLPPAFEQRTDYNWFIEAFGTQDSIIISWPGCTVDDRRLAKFAEALRSPDSEFSGWRFPDLFVDAPNGYTAVRQLTDEPLELTRRAALARLRGTLVGPDGTTSCAVVVVNPDALHLRNSIPGLLLDQAEQHVGLPRSDFHLAGSFIDGVAIDAESLRSMSLFSLPSALISLLLCRLCLKSWVLTLAIAVVAAFGEGLVLTLAYCSGESMNAVLFVMAPLVFVVTISAGVHLVNYYHDELRRVGPERAVDSALRIGRTPCWLAAMTTAIGVGSLVVSEIVPVRQFGWMSAIGVLSTTALLFLVTPGAMQLWPRLWRNRKDAAVLGESTALERKYDAWDRLAEMVCRRWKVFMAAPIILLLAGAAGLLMVRTSVSVQSLLVPESRVIRDFNWLEEHLGPLVPLDVVVHFDGDCPSGLVERVRLVRDVHAALLKMDAIGGAASAASFVPSIPADNRVGDIAERTILGRRLASHLPDLVEAGWLYEAPDEQAWRINARVAGMGDAEYGAFLEELQLQTAAMIAARAQYARASFTGIAPLVYRAQRSLLRDMFSSFLLALGLVALVMMLVQRSIAGGLLVMLPNAFPAIVLFGTMGWLGKAVDVGSVMTAGVALGIAVDDTIHFLSWFRLEIRRGKSRSDAVRLAVRHCGAAMAQTSIICGLGMLTFGLSGFVPMRRFALMMFALLMLALAGALMLLPALLVSPLGGVFSRGSGDFAGKEEPDAATATVE